jgi:hypothetical protein
MLSQVRKLVPRAASKATVRVTQRTAPKSVARVSMVRSYTRTSNFIIENSLFSQYASILRYRLHIPLLYVIAIAVDEHLVSKKGIE